jgi:integrase
MVLGRIEVGHPTPTVERVIGRYDPQRNQWNGGFLEHCSPTRTKRVQDQDKRCAELWTNFLGAKFDLSKYGRRKHDEFVKHRTTGAIDARGNEVDENEVDEVESSKRKPVGPRAVGTDLEWLRTVCLWACEWSETDESPPLMLKNPVRVAKGKKGRKREDRGKMLLPENQNPKRPVATERRYQLTRAKADEVMMEVTRPAKNGQKGVRVRTASYLLELLDLANHTGRRISSILALRYDDLDLAKGKNGWVSWRADQDKEGRKWSTPLNEGARAAIDRILTDPMRALMESPYLFPSPRNFRRRLSRDKARVWLREAEALAGLKPLEQGCWHPYRRKWATERKHLPLQDVMWLGGWTDPKCLQQLYQQPDPAGLEDAAEDARPVHEVVA